MRALTIQTKGPTTMARPRKTVDGVALPRHLYPHPKGGPNRWRYRRADSTDKYFTATLEQAIAYALAANEQRNRVAAPSGPTTLEYWHLKYVEWAETQDPKLKGKDSWYCRKLEMAKMAEQFKKVRVVNITLEHLNPWWDAMTYDQQHNRRSAFSRWWQWMINRGAVKFNPFTTDDKAARLLIKSKPQKSRLPLEIDDFWTIYKQAGTMGYEHVQIAMGISLVTTMRAGDIVALTFKDSVVDNHLRRSIGKSVGQRGHTGASHLSWHLDQHLLLHKLVNRGRELAMKNLACPNVVSYRSRIKKPTKGKIHRSSVTVNRLSHHFAEVVEATKLYINIPPGRRPPTFHEVRGLAIKQALAAKIEPGRVKDLAAHTDEHTTLEYAANHAPTWVPIDIVFDKKMIGGEF